MSGIKIILGTTVINPIATATAIGANEDWTDNNAELITIKSATLFKSAFKTAYDASTSGITLEEMISINTAFNAVKDNTDTPLLDKIRDLLNTACTNNADAVADTDTTSATHTFSVDNVTFNTVFSSADITSLGNTQATVNAIKKDNFVCKVYKIQMSQHSTGAVVRIKIGFAA